MEARRWRWAGLASVGRAPAGRGREGVSSATTACRGGRRAPRPPPFLGRRRPGPPHRVPSGGGPPPPSCPLAWGCRRVVHSPPPRRRRRRLVPLPLRGPPPFRGPPFAFRRRSFPGRRVAPHGGALGASRDACDAAAVPSAVSSSSSSSCGGGSVGSRGGARRPARASRRPPWTVLRSGGRPRHLRPPARRLSLSHPGPPPASGASGPGSGSPLLRRRPRRPPPLALPAHAPLPAAGPPPRPPWRGGARVAVVGRAGGRPAGCFLLRRGEVVAPGGVPRKRGDPAGPAPGGFWGRGRDRGERGRLAVGRWRGPRRGARRALVRHGPAASGGSRPSLGGVGRGRPGGRIGVGAAAAFGLAPPRPASPVPPHPLSRYLARPGAEV